MKCNQDRCDFSRFKNEEKCIFHCDKTEVNGWILGKNILNKNSTPRLEYIWNIEKVNYFWDKIEQVIRISSKLESKNKKSYFPKLLETISIRTDMDKYVRQYFNFYFLKIPPLNNSNIEVENSTYAKCVFNQCTFYDNFILIADRDRESIDISYDFHNCNFENNLSYFRFDSKINDLNLSNCAVKGNLEVNGDIDRININGSRINNILIGNFIVSKIEINEINLFQSRFRTLKISNYKSIAKLYINDLGSLEGNEICLEKISLKTVYIQDIEVNKLKLSNVTFSENSNVNFENIDVNEFTMERISQDSKIIQFNHILVNSKFICNRVNFKNTSFNDFDISSASKEIEKTSFRDAELNSLKWGYIHHIKATKDFFRQLKFVNDKQGNHIEANNFYSMEMKKHKVELKEYSWLSSHLQEKFIFLINEKISNFGQNWIYPVFWMLLFTLVFYELASFNLLLIDAFRENHTLWMLNDILKFSNPFSKTSNIDYSLFYWAWLLHKLFMTVFVYHFILAIKRKSRR